MNDGRVMIDNNPEVWEPLDLATLKLVVSKAEEGRLSPSVGRSTVSRSDFAAGSTEAGTTAGVAVVGSVWGVVIIATFDTIDWTLKYRGLTLLISCSRGWVTNVEPPSLSGRKRRSNGERSRIPNPLFSGVSGISSRDPRNGRFDGCPYSKVSYDLEGDCIWKSYIPF
jgi:hypothetical protein